MTGVNHFIEKLDLGYDHIQGSRFIPGGHHEYTPALRYWGVRLVHSPVLSIAARFWYTDTTNGFRAYSKKFLMSEDVSVFRAALSGYELNYELAVAAGRLNTFKVCEVPVTRKYPKSGKLPSKIVGFRQNFAVLEKVFLVATGGTRKNPPFWHKHFLMTVFISLALNLIFLSIYLS